MLINKAANIVAEKFDISEDNAQRLLEPYKYTYEGFYHVSKQLLDSPELKRDAAKLCEPATEATESQSTEAEKLWRLIENLPPDVVINITREMKTWWNVSTTPGCGCTSESLITALELVLSGESSEDYSKCTRKVPMPLSEVHDVVRNINALLDVVRTMVGNLENATPNKKINRNIGSIRNFLCNTVSKLNEIEMECRST